MATPENPYGSPNSAASGAIEEAAKKSSWKRMLLGFLVGASIPFVFGVYCLLGSHIDIAADSSGTYTSGVIPLEALLLIFIATPLAGFAGAIAARFLWKTPSMR